MLRGGIGILSNVKAIIQKREKRISFSHWTDEKSRNLEKVGRMASLPILTNCLSQEFTNVDTSLMWTLRQSPKGVHISEVLLYFEKGIVFIVKLNFDSGSCYREQYIIMKCL